MTTTQPASSTSATSPSSGLPPELLDSMAAALSVLPDRRSRANALHQVVNDVYALVAWRYDDPYYEELVSLRRIVEEAEAHCERLALLDAIASDPGRSSN